jgi:hypothetical protein
MLVHVGHARGGCTRVLNLSLIDATRNSGNTNDWTLVGSYALLATIPLDGMSIQTFPCARCAMAGGDLPLSPRGHGKSILLPTYRILMAWLAPCHWRTKWRRWRGGFNRLATKSKNVTPRGASFPDRTSIRIPICPLS